MAKARKVRIIEPQSCPGRPLATHIRRLPLLGPLTLASILEQRGFDAGVYNENISGPLDENSPAWSDVMSADVVGISIMTPTAPRGYRLADSIRAAEPGITIVFGGAHATFMPDEAIAHGDVVVRGEGDEVIVDIARGDVTHGIIDAEPVADLDVIPPINHFLMRDFDSLLVDARKREFYELPIATSRGCPYACTYCSVSQMFGRTIRRQSVDKVHRDLKHYASQGFRFMFFYDDNFTSDRDWTRDLLERIEPMHLRFNAQSRVDFHWIDGARTQRDDALLAALRRSGCNALLLGYETVDEDTAKQWHKGYRGDRSLLSRLEEDTRILHDHGIWTYAMFVMGPEHTEKTVDDILAFAKRCEVESVQVSILTPFPGTQLFDEMREHLFLDRFPEDWEYYDATHVVYDNAVLGVEGLHNAVLDAHKRFYRFGGWGSRALKAIARRRAGAVDKVLNVFSRIKHNAGLLDQWRAEMDEYFVFVKKRLAERKKP